MKPSTYVLAALVGLLSLWLGGRWLLGFSRVPTPASDDADATHGRLSQVLQQYVEDGRVDYQGLAAQRQELEAYVTGLAQVGPRSTPDDYVTDDAKLAYYLNAYNALVLHAVIIHWPIGSVHEVRGVVEPKAGFGFFYGLSFELDGQTTNLYTLENDVIRGFGDARIHAAINCASDSCPLLRATPFDPANLDGQLDEAMRAFVGDPRHVDITQDHITLNPIFDWYRADFEQHARPWGGELLDFIEHYLEPAKAAELQRAREAKAAVVFADYDWGLNGRR